jgi:2-polyprenyl-3-methyl-5-hydroxy-6-metoxy-1,4-benzoquinol methylase
MKSKTDTLEVKDHLVSGETFTIRFDAQEGFGKTLLPDNLEVSKYYPDQTYDSYQEKPKGLKGKLYVMAQHFMLRYKLSVLKEHVKGNTLLDVGGGIGVFATFLESRGFQVSISEPNPIARKIAQTKGLKSYATVADISDELKFSCLSLWHVLEHVGDLDEALVKYRNLLEKQGLLVIAVPNINSYDSAYYKSFWAALDVPRHLWHFTPKGLEKKLNACGFKLVNTHPLWFDAIYISYLSETYAKNSAPFLRGLFVGLYSNLKAIFTKEYSSKIYVFKKD